MISDDFEALMLTHPVVDVMANLQLIMDFDRSINNFSPQSANTMLDSTLNHVPARQFQGINNQPLVFFPIT
jgi:hypothetical protein